MQTDHTPAQGSLGGARILLSASLPEIDEDGQRVSAFVREFAGTVFNAAGSLIHGCDPDITPILLDEAMKHQAKGGKKDCLVLVVSRHWSREHTEQLRRWRQSAVVYETPEAAGDDPVESSLHTLRTWMIAGCDAIVAVGGKTNSSLTNIPGVHHELIMASSRGLPCFVLGGFGGAASSFLDSSFYREKGLKNGLDDSAVERISKERDPLKLAASILRQLIRLPLVRGKGTDGTSFRILCLDGGGIKGTFTAAALAHWEQHTGLSIVDHFDLIAGTSTGGILAIGLGLGLSAKQILGFYQEKGTSIFPVTSLVKRASYQLRHLVKPMYSQQTLYHCLRDALYEDNAEITLRDSRCRLLIPSYHALAGTTHLFRTPHHPELTADGDKPAALVALASAAAPTYYSSAAIDQSGITSNYIDGGVWANTPTLAAIVEAVCYLRIPIDRIDMLSVGTTEEPFTVHSKRLSGIVGWARKLHLLLMNGQEESSVKQARLLVGEPRFLRVNATSPKGMFGLDSSTRINELASLGDLAAGQPEILAQIKSRFLNGVPAMRWDRY